MDRNMAMSMQLLGVVEIKEKFPGMNDMIAASKRHWAIYAKMKETFTELVSKATMDAKVSSITNQAVVTLDWHEPTNGRRDPDNVFAAKKFVFDGLVRAGVIPDDNKTWVYGARDNILYDLPKKENGVIISVFNIVV